MSKIIWNESFPDLEEQVHKIKFFEDKFGSPPGPMCYGMGFWLKKYLHIPNFIPLRVEMDHGVPILNKPTQCQLLSPNIIFVTRRSQKLELKRRANKDSLVMGSPLVYCRHLNKIGKSQSTLGTVAFPVHSTHLINVIADWDLYADALLNLPTEFHPITVCLYWKDLLDGHHKTFLNKGIEVVTAGHMADPDFPLNFYKILRSKKYSTSNFLGSYSFYSIEMDIPFFLYKPGPVSFNNFGLDHNVPPGIYDSDSYFETHVSNDQDKAEWLFLNNIFEFDTYRPVTIDPTIKEVSLEKLGLDYPINKHELRVAIYTAFLKFFFDSLKSLIYKVLGSFKFMFMKLVNRIRKKNKKFFPIHELGGVKVYGYGKYLTPVISESIYNNQYEKAELQMLKQYLSKEDIVMEIGSGIGFLSAYCSKLIGSHKVFSYEANPNLQEIIQTTYRINNVNPTFHPCLVGEEAEEKTFYITKDFWSSSFIKPSNDEIVKTITVLAKSFNQEVERVKPSLLIVDVEGGEYELLQNARLDHIQKIIIELHNSLIGRDKINSIKYKLVNSGFKIIQVVPNCDDEILYLERSGT